MGTSFHRSVQHPWSEVRSVSHEGQSGSRTSAPQTNCQSQSLNSQSRKPWKKSTNLEKSYNPARFVKAFEMSTAAGNKC